MLFFFGCFAFGYLSKLQVKSNCSTGLAVWERPIKFPVETLQNPCNKIILFTLNVQCTWMHNYAGLLAYQFELSNPTILLNKKVLASYQCFSPFTPLLWSDLALPNSLNRTKTSSFVEYLCCKYAIQTNRIILERESNDKTPSLVSLSVNLFCILRLVFVWLKTFGWKLQKRFV